MLHDMISFQPRPTNQLTIFSGCWEGGLCTPSTPPWGRVFVGLGPYNTTHSRLFSTELIWWRKAECIGDGMLILLVAEHHLMRGSSSGPMHLRV